MLVTNLSSRSGTFIFEEIKRDLNKYEMRGFKVTDIHGDNEFNNKSLIDALEPVSFHVHAKGEHVGFIENGVKTVKEKDKGVV